MTYAEALAALSALAPRGWRMGLDRMRAYLDIAGLTPSTGVEPPPRFLHVAGTNGKGSVTATLQSLLIAQGYRTGAFFSPFVYDPRERVQLDANLISEDEFARLVTRLLAVGEQLDATEFGGVTEFEVKTAVGFQAWKEANCDWVALEVGLGGRLDATNVVRSSAGCVVSIGWDHMNVLGDSLTKIAHEKAGIAKPGIPLIVGQMDPEPEAEILRVAAEVGAPVWLFGRDFSLEKASSGWRVCLPSRTLEGLKPNLVGVHQPHNMAVALATLDAGGAVRNPDALAEGIARTRLPGRFEQRVWNGLDVILDGAHNLDSAQALADTLRAERPGAKVVMLTGMLTGHEPEPFYSQFSGLVEEVVVAPIDFHRSREPDELAAELPPVFRRVASRTDLSEALSLAVERCQQDGTLLVTGSFYLVGEVGRLLDRG